MFSDPLLVVARLASVFDNLGISYVVGGSLASSIYGIPRATQDVDLMADVRLIHVEPITKALREDFYIDPESVKDAIRDHGSFNVIHLATMFKADIFIAKGDAWWREEMIRAREETFQAVENSPTVRFASPEDTILHKLVWYKLGDEVSERQWSDIIGVLRVQAGALDHEYLDRWAGPLMVANLLARATAESKKSQ